MAAEPPADGRDPLADDAAAAAAGDEGGGEAETAASAAEALLSAGSEQLTLVYQGEVYVFDPVPPQKVQAVLLVLGGSDMPPGLVSMAVPTTFDEKLPKLWHQLKAYSGNAPWTSWSKVPL
uniref:Tify domain-containing protein n=1 Tax=Leersia perrieri TaxID=77586 RepID=A0A0D9VYN6_9ORYZ